MEKILEENGENWNLVLLGKTGAGKSATGNTILGRPAFMSKKSSNSVTQDVTVESGTVCGYRVTVYDTPGFCDTQMSEEKIQEKFQNILQKCESRRCVFLLIMKADRFTAEERNTLEKIEKLLGQNHIQKTWILFTRGDELEDENMTIDDFIKDTEALQKQIQKYEGRYHVFNNKNKTSGQVKMLLKKVSGGEKKLKEIPDKFDENLPRRKLVLLGKTGVGKSRAGNTLLGKKAFKSELSAKSVTTKCQKKRAKVEGRNVSVVDTPGFFDTEMDPEMLILEIARSVFLSTPGPHAFLIVFPANARFTEQEQEVVEQIKTLFGEDMLKYSIVLFTHGDLLKGESIEKLIEGNSALRDLVKQCGGRYHVFNNENDSNRQQVSDLLQKIDTMIEQNGGRYTNEMFEEALRCKQAEEERRQREEERQSEIEEHEKKQRQEEIEAEKRKIMEEYESKLAELKSELKRNTDRSQTKEEDKQVKEGGQNEEKGGVEKGGEKNKKEEKWSIFQWFKNFWKIILSFILELM